MSDQREVCLVVGEGDVVLWSDASDDPSALPDSRARWDAIWARRGALVEIAHSHPRGPAAFSQEDHTTMEALVMALGRPLRFSVVAPTAMMVRECHLARGEATNGGDEVAHGADLRVSPGDEPWWADLLRLASGMRRAEEE